VNFRYNKYNPKGKVKCTLVQALRLCRGRMAHRGSRGITILFLDHGTRRGQGSGVSVTPRPQFTPGKYPVPILQEAGWAPGPVWTGAENLAPTGIRFPDHPARRQSLYRLSYPGPPRHSKPGGNAARQECFRLAVLYVQHEGNAIIRNVGKPLSAKTT